MWKLVPKRGFYKPKREFLLLSVGDLKEALVCGRLSLPTDGPLTIRHFFQSRLLTIRGRHAGVKLLARGHETFDFPINIEVQDASKLAIEAIEKAGGKITTVYYTRLTMRGLLKPEKFAKKKRLLPRPALPPPKLRKRYLDPDRRGYLADLEIGDVIRPHEQPPHVLLPEKYRKTQDAAGNDGEPQA